MSFRNFPLAAISRLKVGYTAQVADIKYQRGSEHKFQELATEPVVHF
jgi:hypothetical protein